MKISHSIASFFISSTLLFGTAAQAGGTHAGGHGDKHDETAAIGEPGKPALAKRTVTVAMSDAMRFEPASVTVRQGETVHFVVQNKGQLVHEFVLGTTSELKEHAELMKKFPNMKHEEPNMVSVAPGKTGEVTWKFTRAGTVDFACLQPGHFDAGMKGAVTVAGTKSAKAGAAAHPATHQH